MTNGSLMKVESIAEVLLSKVLLQGEHSAILWPALSDNWSWKPICGLIESGRFTQVLLYEHLMWYNFIIGWKHLEDLDLQ